MQSFIVLAGQNRNIDAHAVTRFAVFCPPFPSHTSALGVLCSELIDRGHEVVWLQQADVRRQLTDARIQFQPVGETRYQPGSLQALLARAARPGGPVGLRRVIRDVAGCTDMLCNEAPAQLRILGIEAVLADQMEAAGGLVATALGLPFVSVACALPVNREARVPLPVMPWSYAEDDAALHRNAVSERIYDWLMQPHAKVIAAQSARLGLPGRRTIVDCLSPLLQLSQTTCGFDFPRVSAPQALWHVGPLRRSSSTHLHAVAEELAVWQPVPDRPFVFASLGTLQGWRLPLFKRIARACRAIDAQLLVAHCGGLDAMGEEQLRRAGAQWVVAFADQAKALERADLLVTHGGLNTVMDGLAAGVPMLALPIAFDQPGVAARVAHAGVGLRLMPARASTNAIKNALRTLLSDPSYKVRARALGAEVHNAAGVAGAADLIESVLPRLNTKGIERFAMALPSAKPETARPMQHFENDADLILVGGGLANSLIAWRLRQTQPGLRTMLLESGSSLGGNHTWSFHTDDLTAAQREWIAPLIAHRWPAYEVRFPGFSRRLEGEYCSITSERFHATIYPALAHSIHLRSNVVHLTPTEVRLANGRVLRANAVLDARGPARSSHLDIGYQKFLGLEVRTRAPHGLLCPLLMDAQVSQDGGFRFVYVLPLDNNVLLIEDTCYANDAHLDRSVLEDRIARYATEHGWTIEEVLRSEEGILPILLGGDIDGFLANDGQVPRAGLAAGLFHPTTGYSLPEAAAVADLLAHAGVSTVEALHQQLQRHTRARWKAGRFFRLLNRMLFRAAQPTQRRIVMARFYKLDAGLISRFYAARLRGPDKLRILLGRPPVPLSAALHAALDRPRFAQTPEVPS